VEDSDDALAARALAGEAAAFERLVDRHYADCLRYATRMLGDVADAEEVVQDVFVRAFRSLPRYDRRDRFRGWLLRILVNRCRSAGARRARRRELAARYGVLREERPVQPGAEDGLGLREELARALGRLPREQREAFLLRHVEELSYEEIARLTGVGVSALKMRVKRAGDRLRELLREVIHG
jgi:RNA polymerase sigma-70 factor (ECF subfamily)